MDSALEIRNTPYRNGNNQLVLDTRATLDEVMTHPQCPVFLHSALYGKTSWQKRSEFTIERVLAAPGLAPQFAGALLAWGAWGIGQDDSELSLEELISSELKTRPAALVLPLDVPDRAWGEARTGSTPQDFPIVWAMAVVDLAVDRIQKARIALSGTWEQSVALAHAADLLLDRPLSSEMIDQVATAVADEVAPRGDYRGSAKYRKAMAGVMTRRALEACLEPVPGSD